MFNIWSSNTRFWGFMLGHVPSLFWPFTTCVYLYIYIYMYIRAYYSINDMTYRLITGKITVYSFCWYSFHLLFVGTSRSVIVFPFSKWPQKHGILPTMFGRLRPDQVSISKALKLCPILHSQNMDPVTSYLPAKSPWYVISSSWLVLVGFILLVSGWFYNPIISPSFAR